jgi:CHAP domain
MRSVVAQSLVWGACLIAGLIAPTKPSRGANCALYARAETGVALYGAAGGWWDEADGRYERGHAPAVGAILVFRRTHRIPSGHVAVVARIISAREILVDQANWYRGTVSRGMSVIDTSPGHDWTSVAVMDLPSGKHGSDYPTYGFVYPKPGPREIVEARAGGGLDSYVVDSWGSSNYDVPPGLLHLAADTEDQQSSIDAATAMQGNHYHKGTSARRGHKAPSPLAHNHTVPRARSASPGHAAASPAHASGAHARLAHSPTHAVKTAEARHHRA